MIGLTEREVRASPLFRRMCRFRKLPATIGQARKAHFDEAACRAA